MNNIRSAFLVGSGVLVDITTSATITDTRLQYIHATGSGIYIVDGTSVTALGNTIGNVVKFSVSGTAEIECEGVRMDGSITITAPSSASTLTVFYG